LKSKEGIFTWRCPQWGTRATNLTIEPLLLLLTTGRTPFSTLILLSQGFKKPILPRQRVTRQCLAAFRQLSPAKNIDKNKDFLTTKTSKSPYLAILATESLTKHKISMERISETAQSRVKLFKKWLHDILMGSLF
jgi:hypothetical protein